MKLIETKENNEEVEVGGETKARPDNVINLMDALHESLDRAKGEKPKSKKPKKTTAKKTTKTTAKKKALLDPMDSPQKRDYLFKMYEHLTYVATL